MVWPSTRAPQGTRYVQTLDRTVLGRFYLGEKEVYNLWNNAIPERILAKLKVLDHWSNLPEDVLVKYSKASFNTVRRIVYLWRGIEASVLASNPKLIGRTPSSLHCRLWRWCITTAIHSYDNCAKLWKKVTLHVLHYVNKVPRDHENPMPYGIPGCRSGALLHSWFEMLPALKYFASAKLISDFSVVPVSAYDDIGHFIQSRMMPPPPLTEKRFEAEYLEIRRQFTRQSTWDQELERELQRALDRFGNYLANVDFKPRPHISLSGSGCYECPRIDGGRAMYIQRLFIEKYVRVPSADTISAKTLWGAPYRLQIERKPYRTMCRAEPLRDDIEFINSAFRDEMAPGGLLAAVFGSVNDNMTLEEPMFGLDREFPHQILQLCVDEAVEKGYIAGPNIFGPRVCFEQNPIPAEVIFQPESGNKVRALCEAPAVVTVLLQPFAHWLASLVGRYPTLRSAFSRSYKGWDLAVMCMRNTNNFVEPESGFSVIDLVGSTNGFDWKFMRQILNRLMSRFTRNIYEVSYFTMCVNLLLAPRLMKVRKHHKDPDYRIIRTERGVHMGDPGSKEILCTFQALVELMVYCDVPRLPPSLIAGDDHGALRTMARHNDLVSKHKAFGNEIQETKAQYSYNMAWFCEELLVYIDQAINMGKAPWMLSKDEDHLNLHRDIVKMRLLAPFASTGEMEISKNPAYGKGSALYDQLLVHKNRERAGYLLHTFNNWMSSFLREDPLVYLPRVVGGLNVPWPHSVEELEELLLDKVHPLIAVIYDKLSSGDEAPMLFHVLTRRMSTGTSARGIIDPMTTFATVQYATIATSQFQAQSKTLDMFLAEIQLQKSYPCNYKDALAHARRSGYVSYATIADNLDRVTAMRITLACAAGAFPLEDIVDAGRERRPSPNEVLKNFLEVELPQSHRLYGVDPKDLQPSPESMGKFKKWVRQRCPNFVTTTKKGWVPAAAITDSLNGMTIDIPAKEWDVPVPGSVSDPHAAPQDGYAATVISRKRLKLS